MEGLKRCPFCGGEAKLNITRGFKGEVIAAFVYCTKCGVSTFSYTLEKSAKEVWNRGGGRVNREILFKAKKKR